MIFDAVQLLLLAGLAIYVIGRKRTRTSAGALLVLVTICLTAGLAVLDTEWAGLAQGLAFGVAAAIAIYAPRWLGRPKSFSETYDEVERRVGADISRAEHDWRRDYDDVAYARKFGQAYRRYEALDPPQGPWARIIRDRIEIGRQWSAIWHDPSHSLQEERDRLGVLEDALRDRVASARRGNH